MPGLLDVALVLLLAVSAIDGARVGGLQAALSTAVLVASVAIAAVTVDDLTRATTEIASFPYWPSRAVALGEVLLLGETLLTLALRYVVGHIPHPGGWLGFLSILAGAAAGATRGVLAAVAGLAILTLFPLAGSLHEEVDTSRFGSQVLVAALRYDGPGAFATQKLFEVRWAGTGEDQLDVPIGLKTVRADDVEALLATLANRERRDQGLRDLTVDPRLSEIARRHGEEMIRLRYLGHRSPITGLVDDRVREAGIAGSITHEVIVMGTSAIVIHERVARSVLDGPRMLDPKATRMGFGVVDAGIYGLVVTELFLVPQ